MIVFLYRKVVIQVPLRYGNGTDLSVSASPAETVCIHLLFANQLPYKSTLKNRVNSCGFTRLLPHPEESRFPPVINERIPIMKLFETKKKTKKETKKETTTASFPALDESGSILSFLSLPEVKHGSQFRWNAVPYAHDALQIKINPERCVVSQTLCFVTGTRENCKAGTCEGRLITRSVA